MPPITSPIHADYVGIGLDTAAFDIDRTLAARLNGIANVTYVSLIDQLCRRSSRRSDEGAKAEACLARVPEEGGARSDGARLRSSHAEGVVVPRASTVEAVPRLGHSMIYPAEASPRRRIIVAAAGTCCIFKAIGMPDLPFDPPKDVPRRGLAAVAASDNGATQRYSIATSSRCIPHFASTTSAISRSAGS
jgi:hypothetical protein